VSHLSLFSYSEEGQNGRIEIAKKSLWGKVSKIPNPRMPASVLKFFCYNIEMEEKALCLFCDRDNLKNNIFIENDFCYARWDNFPVSRGHAEIVPKKHVESFFELTPIELEKFYSLIKETKNLIQKEHNPDGYNIGINEGETAGRTIHHLHLHLIPRYKGDVPNPRGGIRNIISEKGDY
jgi:diadenosine tetraphosphate (Ap4A) HIT family hydrolase